MSNYPELADVFVNKTGSDSIASSDPNNAFDGIEAIEGFLGALGKPQSWSNTLLTTIRRFKRGMNIGVESGVPVVRAGEIVLENTDGTRLVFRRNTGGVTLAAGNIDVGTLIATTYYIYAKGGTAVSTSPMVFSTDINAPSAIGTAPYAKIGWFLNTAVGALATTFAGNSGEMMHNPIVQIANVQTGAVLTGTGTLPSDDSIPQNTEGDQYMTLAITPTSAANKLKIDVVFNYDLAAAYASVIALFQDSTAGALAGVIDTEGANITNGLSVVAFTHYMTAGTTSTTTFKVRAGRGIVGASEILTFNGSASARLLGGVMASSITITEIEA